MSQVFLHPHVSHSAPTRKRVAVRRGSTSVSAATTRIFSPTQVFAWTKENELIGIIFLGYCMEQRKFPNAFRGRPFILSRVGKLAAILSLPLFAIQPMVWAKTKTAVMECTMQNGKIVDKSGHPIGDCVLLKDGRMMMITKGKMMPITKDIMLANGTVCKADGTCVLKNGQQIQLSNGEGIEVAGEKV